VKAILFLLLLGACGLTAAAQTKSVISISSDENGYSWAPFAPKDGRFSVMMPAPPATTNSESDSPDGKIIYHSFAAKLNETLFQVAYSEYPIQISDANGMLDRMREIIPKHNGKILKERTIALGKFPGREWWVLQTSAAIGIVRLFVVENRTYQVNLLMSLRLAFKNGRPSLNSEDQTSLFVSTSSRFYDSFKLIENASSPP
jgi:hypothetical protein